MTVHSFHIFDRKGKTLFTKRYSNQAKQAQPTGDTGMEEDEFLAEQRKLVFGMLFSLRELVGSLGPDGGVADLHSIKTGACTLHTHETRSGLRLALYTKRNSQPKSISEVSIRDALRHIYSELWVDCVVRSPLYRHGELNAERALEARLAGGGGGGNNSSDEYFDISSTNFEKKLDAYLSSKTWFR